MGRLLAKAMGLVPFLLGQPPIYISTSENIEPNNSILWPAYGRGYGRKR